MDNCIFSVYGISIRHPLNWRVYLDPKRGFNLLGGFIRIENYVSGVGAEVSMSINWDTVPSDSESFPKRYCESIEAQYQKQFKKNHSYGIESAGIINHCGIPAAYVISNCSGSQLLVHNKKDCQAVKVMHLAFYHESTGRAVVGTVIAKKEIVDEQEEFLKSLLFTLRAEDYTVDCQAIGALEAGKLAESRKGLVRKLFSSKKAG